MRLDRTCVRRAVPNIHTYSCDRLASCTVLDAQVGDAMSANGPECAHCAPHPRAIDRTGWLSVGCCGRKDAQEPHGPQLPSFPTAHSSPVSPHLFAHVEITVVRHGGLFCDSDLRLLTKKHTTCSIHRHSWNVACRQWAPGFGAD